MKTNTGIDTATLDAMITYHSLAETLAWAVMATEGGEFGVIEMTSLASGETVRPAGQKGETVRASGN